MNVGKQVIFTWCHGSSFIMWATEAEKCVKIFQVCIFYWPDVMFSSKVFSSPGTVNLFMIYGSRIPTFPKCMSFDKCEDMTSCHMS